jgi:hypothetical protein
MNFKSVVMMGLLALSLGCTEVDREVNNFYDLDGTWSSDVDVTIRAEGQEDEIFNVPGAWVTFDQTGPAVAIFSHAGLGNDRGVSVNSKRDVYLFGPFIMAKVTLEGDLTRDGGEVSSRQDILFQNETGGYDSIGVVTYVYDFGPMTEVKDGAVVEASSASAASSSKEAILDLFSARKNGPIGGEPDENTDFVFLQEPFSNHQTFLPLGRKILN